MKLKFEHYCLISIVLLVGISVYFSWKSPLARAIRSGQSINGLIIGTDWVDYARHSDTLIFVNYKPDERFLTVISIPRDTHFNPPGYNFRRINEIYAYHYRTKKNDYLACREVTMAVERIFQNKLTIPYYVQIDYKSFKKIIDLIGGVTVEIEESMHYDDKAGNLHINFDAGIHRLNGDEALEYVRYRGKAGDLGRVFRQQRFIKAVLAKLKNPYTLLKFPQIIYVIIKEMKTNLSFGDFLAGLFEIKDLKTKDLRLAQLPGTPKKDYWEVDGENCVGLLEKVVPSTGTAVSEGPKLRVEVWNASGKNKLAEKINWILRKHGFDVIDWGTFSVRQKKTLIKDLTGDLRAAQKISEILNCGEVITRYDEKRFVDISVTLGEDCIVSEESPKKRN